MRFHVDDLMSSHVDKQVNINFLAWLNRKYESYGKVAVTQGKVYDYLGMVFDFSKKGNLIIDMSKYTSKMVTDFEKKYGILTGMAKVIAKENVFGPSKRQTAECKDSSPFPYI